MKLKELLKEIEKNKKDCDVVWVYYKNPRMKDKMYVSHLEYKVLEYAKYYQECDVNDYKVVETKWIDPVSTSSGFCKQHNIEIDWDEVRIIKEMIKRERAKR